ncbi:MAG: alpha/beta hydrolase [Acidimicrobiales bacterium]
MTTTEHEDHTQGEAAEEGPGAAPPWPPRPGHRPPPGRRANRRRSLMAVPRPGNPFDTWPITARIARAAVQHPQPMLRALGEREPRWADGRKLHPAMQLLAALSARQEGPNPTFDPPAMRRDMRNLTKLGTPWRHTVHAHDRKVPGDGVEIPVRCYRPHGAPGQVPGIVYAHGGGFVVGDLDTHDATCRLLADVAGCVVVAVDYRLAPEHPFPAALDDVVAAFRWVHHHADELGIDPAAIGVAGDSAGATISAGVCHETRRLGLPTPTVQGLIYPLVDIRMRFDSYETFAEGFSLTRRTMDWFRDQYLPHLTDELLTDPRVSPLCGDLTGLPPAVIATAGFDPLRDDGRAYADALREAGVDVTYRCYDDFLHGFYGMMVLPDAAAACVEIDRALGRVLWEAHRAARDARDWH